MKDVFLEAWKEFAGVFLGVVMICGMISGCTYIFVSQENWRTYGFVFSLGFILGIFGIMMMKKSDDAKGAIIYTEDPKGAGLRLTLHVGVFCIGSMLVSMLWVFTELDPMLLVVLWGAGVLTLLGVVIVRGLNSVGSLPSEYVEAIPVVEPRRDEHGLWIYTPRELKDAIEHSGPSIDEDRGNWME